MEFKKVWEKYNIWENKKVFTACLVCVCLLVVVVGFMLGKNLQNREDTDLFFKGNKRMVLEQETERKNTYVIGVSQLPMTNLSFLQTMEGSKVINDLVYPSLAFLKDGNYTYELAKKITFDNNGKTAYIQLDGNEHFSDGCFLRADDVIYTYYFLSCADVQYDQKQILTCIEGDKEYQSGKKEGISGIEKISDTELKIEFVDASMDNFKIFEIPMIHPHNHDYERKDIRSDYLGCGSYRIEENLPYQKILLVPNSYAQEQGNYAKIEIVTADVKKLETQEIDRMVIPESKIETVKGYGAYDIYQYMKSERDFLVFNLNNIVMHDEKQRREIGAIIDTEALFENSYETGRLSKGIFSGNEQEPNYISSSKHLYSRKVKEIVFQYGYSGTEQNIADILVKQLNKNGIIVERYNADENLGFPQHEDVSFYYYHGYLEEIMDEWSMKDLFLQLNNKALSKCGDLIENTLIDSMYAIPLHNEEYYVVNLCTKETIENNFFEN